MLPTSLSETPAMKSLLQDHANAIIKKALLRLIVVSEKKNGCTDMDMFNNAVSEVQINLASEFIHEGLCGHSYSNFQYFFSMIQRGTHIINRCNTDEETIDAIILEQREVFGDFNTNVFYTAFKIPVEGIFKMHSEGSIGTKEFIFMIRLITCFTNI